LRVSAQHVSDSVRRVTTFDSAGPTLGQVVAVVEKMYDPTWAREWDRVGLVCGDPGAVVRRVMLAVDPTQSVAEEALAWRADLLFTHHPLLLRPVHGVPATTAKGRVVHNLIRGGCALYAAHTNADVALRGVSDALARVLGLTDLVPLEADPVDPVDKVVTFVPQEHAEAVVDALAAAGAGTIGQYARCAWTTSGLGTFVAGDGSNPAVGEPGQRTEVAERRVEMVAPRAARRELLAALRSAHPYEEPAVDLYELADWSGPRGIGRVGRLSSAKSLRDFAMVVAEALPSSAQGVRVSGDAAAMIRTVAVCGGAGDTLLRAARRAGVDAFVTADLRHHPASEARESAGDGPPYLIDVAHWASEWPWLAGAANRLQGHLEAAGTPIETHVSMKSTDPWTFRVPSPTGVVR
jgi:dinuclear metal center YbgI/SA1388 family protein